MSTLIGRTEVAIKVLPPKLHVLLDWPSLLDR